MWHAMGKGRGGTTLLVCAALLLLLLPSSATPLTLAGSVIKHRFQARFGNAAAPSSITSNETQFTVGDLCDLSIVPPRSAVTLAGRPVDFLHTISNRGNTPDRFLLRAIPVPGAQLPLEGSTLKMQFFLASDGSPLPLDPGGLPVTGVVAAGETLDLILRVTPPPGSEGRQAYITVSAISQLTPSRTSSLNDQLVVPLAGFDAPVKVVLPAGAVLPGALLTYGITFTNSDSLAATGVVVSDPLDPLLDYVPGSASFSTGVAGSATFNPASQTLTFSIPTLSAGASATVTFQARVKGSAPIDSVIRNTAQIASDENSLPQSTNTTETPVLGQPLRVTKGVATSAAEVGDIVTYSVRLENVGTLPLNHVTLEDQLPRGFRYLKGSTVLDGSPFMEPAGGGQELSWDIGTLLPGQVKTLGYRTVVSAETPVGSSINRAQAVATTPGGISTSSPQTSAKVLIRSSLLGSKAIILGRVFVDANANGMPDPGEEGLPGVRIYLDDGSFTFTDPAGQYSFTGISAGNHVVKIDRTTLPAGLRPIPFNTAFAGVGWSQFITVPFGGPARGDFALEGKVEVVPPPSAPQAPAPEPVSEAGAFPGELKRLVVNPERVDLPADGKSVVPFTVELLSAEGRRVAGDRLVTATLQKGGILEPDADPVLAGHQIRVHDGVGVFHVRAGRSTGAAPILLETPNAVARVDLYLGEPLRDWIVVGLGSLTVGAKAVSGHLEPIDKDDRFEEGLFHEERLSFYTRGKVLGKYLLSAAYDSGKERREGLFQEIDPEKYYPVYGDASDIGYEAQSRGKLYLKLEAGRSYIIGGDYRTDLSENEFSRYDRALNGVKLELNEPGVQVKGFASRSEELLIRDEIPGNGTSGYFFLSRKPVFENSERVRIETRDRYHTERVLSVVEKQRYADYSIDYGAGTILFKEPVPSLDKQLNPITIVVNYQSLGGGPERYVYGGRALLSSREGSYLGGSAVVEQGAVRDNTLYGVDAGVRLGERVTLKGEGAVSDTLEHGRGSAWKTELFAHPLEELDLGAYYRKVDADFFNPSMTGRETGTQKFGGRADYRILPRTVLLAESFVQKDELQGTTLFGNQLGVTRKFSLMDGEAGYLRIEEERSGVKGHSDLIYAGAKGPLTPRLDATLRREQLLAPSIVRDYQTKSYLRLDYRITESTRAFLTEEYQEGSPRLRQATILGLESRLSERMTLATGYQIADGELGVSRQGNVDLNTRLYDQGGWTLNSRTGYQLEHSLSQQRGQAIVGLNSRYEFARGILLRSSLERVQTVQGSGGTGTAFTMAGEYLRPDALKMSGRYEVKSGPGELTSLYGAQLAYKVNPSLTLLAKSSLWDRDADLGRDLIYDGYLGASWRPLAGHPLQLLTLARFKLEEKGSLAGAPSRKGLTLSAEPIYRITSRWTLQGKYAGKLSWDEVGGFGVQSYTDLALAGISYDLGERWELAAYLKLANQYDAGVHSLGAVTSLGYRVYRNVVLNVGYNYARLEDRDLTGESFQGQGPFFGVKVKFDEEMFQSEEATVQTLPVPRVVVPPKAVPPAVALAPPPAVIPALYLVGEKLDRPLEISGSAELLTLLVNGEKTWLPSTKVSVTREHLEGSVELEGDRLKRPITFQTQVEKPEGARSWSFSIMNGLGRSVHQIRGSGAPPQQIVWDGETQGTPLVPGEVYQYQLELAYRDGSSFSTGRGLFGVSRQDAVLLTLSGGAFVFESATLTEEAKRLLNEAAQVLKAHPTERVIVEGHTDAIGTVPYNMRLSQRRCDAAANYLVRSQGIPEARLIRRWYGKARPIADNVTTPGRRLNRRVELKGDFPQMLPVSPEPFRAAPFAVVNGKSLPLDPDGRFATTLPADVGRLDVQLGDSSGRSLATVLPVPALHVAAPDGERTVPFGTSLAEFRVDENGSASCTLAGATDPGTRVELEGKSVAVDPAGGFSTELSLDKGENVFGMVLRNGAGCSRLVNFRVKSSRRELDQAGNTP